MRRSQVGSPSYLSPEQLSNSYYNKKIDVWSIGIITYELLFGYSPFEDEIGAKLQNNGKKLSLNLTFPKLPEVTECAKDFIAKLLTKNPN
jgi:serine/threonine protein kinase